MKRILPVALPLAALIIVMTGATAGAQSDQQLSVRVPFEFKVGEKVMPAGKYDVEVSPARKSVALWPAGSKRGGEQVVTGEVLTLLGSGGERGTLVFDKRGDGNLLSEVWLTNGRGYLIQGDIGDLDHQHRLVKATKPVQNASARKKE